MMRILSKEEAENVKRYISPRRAAYPKFYEQLDKLEVGEALSLLKLEWWRYYKTDPSSWWTAVKHQNRPNHKSRFLGKDFKVIKTYDSFVFKRIK